MPWESRIQSERVRHIVIAAIMMVLLGGSTVLAMWLSHARRASSEPPTTAMFDSFEASIPGGWDSQDSSAQKIPGLVAAYIRTEGEPRLLHVLRYDLPSPQPPIMSLRAVVTSYFPRAKQSESGEFTGHHTVGAFIRGRSEETSRRGAVRQMHSAATVTLDGQRHIAFYMTGPGDPTESDRATVIAIAQSVVDRHYEPVAERQVDLGTLRVDVPADLAALRPVGDTSSLHFVPARGGRFVTGNLLHLSLRVLSLAEEEQADDAPTDDESNTAGDVNQLLPTWLANLYQRRYGTAPPNGAQASVQINGRLAHGLLLPVEANSQTQQMLWAASLDGKSVAILNIAADQRAAQAMAPAARMVLGNLSVAPAATSDAPRTEDPDQAR